MDWVLFADICFWSLLVVLLICSLRIIFKLLSGGWRPRGGELMMYLLTAMLVVSCNFCRICYASLQSERTRLRIITEAAEVKENENNLLRQLSRVLETENADLLQQCEKMESELKLKELLIRDMKAERVELVETIRTLKNKHQD